MLRLELRLAHVDELDLRQLRRTMPLGQMEPLEFSRLHIHQCFE
jgi:hypothetical protein